VRFAVGSLRVTTPLLYAAARHVNFDVDHAWGRVGVTRHCERTVIAGANYRKVRGLGVTVRKKVDVLIGVCCLERRYELLHADRDFDAMENHLGLRVGQTELSVHEPPMAAYGAR
jgi:predicted nucleic acid-binding protein